MRIIYWRQSLKSSDLFIIYGKRDIYRGIMLEWYSRLCLQIA